MDSLEYAKRMIETMFATPVTIFSPPEEIFLQFQNAYCFNSHIQRVYTARELEAFLENADQTTVYELHEPLGTVTIRFFLHEQLVIVGPYTESAWDMADSERTLSELGISSSFLHAYKLYKSQYSVLDTKYVLRAVAALLEMEGFAFSSLGFQRLEERSEKLTGGIVIPDRYQYKTLNQRHAVEKEFMEAISRGDSKQALSMQMEMSRLSSQQTLSIAKSSSYTVIAASIMRTIIRLAAQQGGLPPIIIDAVSESYSQKMVGFGRAPSEAQIGMLTHDLVVEICNEIGKLQTMGYSSLVRKTIHYIYLNLGHNLSLPVIAQELDVSASHLSKSFKAETGMCLSHYVMRERSQKAASLLTTTNHSVQDISSYVGYADANYFVKVFRRYYALSPTEYRKQNKL